MNSHTFLAAGLTVALASMPAFAQDLAPTDSPAIATPMASDNPTSHSTMHSVGMHHHVHRPTHRRHLRHTYSRANSDEGMPTDHSGDHLIVAPTETKITLPAGG